MCAMWFLHCIVNHRMCIVALVEAEEVRHSDSLVTKSTHSNGCGHHYTSARTNAREQRSVKENYKSFSNEVVSASGSRRRAPNLRN